MERNYFLPERIEGSAMEDISACAEEFEVHLGNLEKEHVCATLLSAFTQYSGLDVLLFSLMLRLDESPTAGFQKPASTLLVEGTFLDDTDAWQANNALTELFSATLSPRLLDFYDDLRITRRDVFSEHGTPRFATMRTMRTWIELDLK